jgi:[ribosomal protein S5]-alanine N-acetyltransferase
MPSRNAFLKGDTIYLRALMPKDLEGPYISWFNDEECCRGNRHHIYPFTRVEAENYIRSSRDRYPERLICAIVLKSGDLHIGNIALYDINPLVRSAELAIMIGNKSCWGKGIGKEACKLLCDHGFKELNISRIGCATFETNKGMIGIARYLGMKEEGRRRQEVFKNGRYLDILEFGVLQDEYERYWNDRKKE